MNSTDKEKRAILAMFEEPIKEVEEEFYTLAAKLKTENKSVLHLLPLKEKIDTLKSKLPTVQGGE